jgi:putative membrane protein
MPSSSPQITNHLANERTFLAWLRTSIALISFGVVIVRLSYLSPANAKPEPTNGGLNIAHIGLMFACVGLLMVAFALFNFFTTRRALESEKYVPRAASVVLFSMTVLLLGIAVVVYLSGFASLQMR